MLPDNPFDAMLDILGEWRSTLLEGGESDECDAMQAIDLQEQALQVIMRLREAGFPVVRIELSEKILLNQPEFVMCLVKPGPMGAQKTAHDVLEGEQWEICEDFLVDWNTHFATLSHSQKHRLMDMAFGLINSSSQVAWRADVHAIEMSAKEILGAHYGLWQSRKQAGELSIKTDPAPTRDTLRRRI